MKKPQLSEDEICTQKALTQLQACTSTIRDLENAIRAMVDDVIITTQSGTKLDVLMAWESGKEYVDEVYAFLLSVQEETLEYTDNDSFDKLDGQKKVEYVDTMSAIQKDTYKLHAQYHYFLIIYSVEQTEQIIALLWDVLRSQCNLLLSGQLDGSIKEQHILFLKRNIQLLRARLGSEIQKVLEQISTLTKKQHFLDMEIERRNEYYVKWEKHSSSIPDISLD